MMSEVIVLLISVVFIGVGLYQWQRGTYLMAHGKIANGIVFRNNYKSSKDGGTYHPVVRFLTDKQEWITQELGVGYTSPMEEGTRVEVIYDPEEPTDVDFNSPFALKVGPKIFVALGICGFVVGVLEMLDVIQFIE